jgi:hypothetical protein
MCLTHRGYEVAVSNLTKKYEITMELYLLWECVGRKYATPIKGNE